MPARVPRWFAYPLDPDTAAGPAFIHRIRTDRERLVAEITGSLQPPSPTGHSA